MGCPVSYDGKTYTWTRGKLSKISYGSLTSGNHTHNFTYNALGQRVEKSYSYFKKNTASGGFGEAAVTYTTSKNTKYYYDHGGRLIAEYCVENFSDFTQESTRLEYLYDESGMIGFKYYASGVDMGAYYYQRNLQGDVVTIYNTNGTIVASYAYDAYGNCTIISGTSSDIAYVNPIRYRGYYWDSETGLYYLNARYYSPEWRRFISPDDTAYLDPESVNGLNLYCYCNNDPVNYADPSGHSLLWILGLVGVAAGFAYGAYTDYQDDSSINGSIGWQSYLGYSLLGGAIGVGIGFTIGYFGPAALAYLGGFGVPNALAVAGGGTVAVANVGILEAMLAAGALILFARTSKRNGYYGEGWPGDPHKPEHIHLRGNNCDVRIGKDGNPLPNEPKLTHQQRKALEKLWKEFADLFNAWSN